MLIPVILSGGVGSRLWPLSRELYPKQFLPLTGNLSFLEKSLQRSQVIENASNPIIVCNEEHRFMVAQQLRNMNIVPHSIVLEPVAKNTAPAVAVAAFCALKEDPNALLLVMPADHVVKDIDVFSAVVNIGLPQAEKGKLVTFGVVPDVPETGYGYIRRGHVDDDGGFSIAEFIEKPTMPIAREYIAAGNYYWNSGIFLFAAQFFLEELKQYSPDIYAVCSTAVENAEVDMDFVRISEADFQHCPSDSIDYAVMEKTDSGVVVPLSCGWSDVGSWSSLWEVGEKDESGNVVIGDVINYESKNSYIHSSSRLVTTLGLKNTVVVETADAILVANKDNVQNLKEIVSQLKSEQRSEVSTHTKVYRPWGSYESLVVSERFQVKRIIVNPDQQLSLQLHHHRAEHWTVVSGTALVTCGEKEFILAEDQSTYIPLGTKHRLANQGVIPLELIEVQSGSYLGEDDIVRFQDVYGRSN